MGNNGRSSGGLVWLSLAGVALVVLLGLIFSSSFLKKSDDAAGNKDVAQTRTEQAPSAAPAAAKQGGAINISIASSNTKQDWLWDVTAAFNQRSKNESAWQLNGKPIVVTILQETVDGKKADYRSGAMVSDIVKKKIQPTVISPGEESWVDRLKKDWQIQESGQLISGDAPILVRTPLVIAMWQSRASVLNAFPDGPGASWETVKGLSVSGWQKYKHPEWGKLKIGYGYFGESNSGTLAVVNMAAVGAKKGNLEFNDIKADAPAGQFIAQIEKSKVHSGKSDVWLLEKMIQGGQEYLDAVVTYESNVIKMNREHAKEMSEPLVCLYPQDGTVVVGHPFAILDRAPWVSEEQAKAAEVYRKFLLDKEQQEKVQTAGLRPADKSIKLGSPFDLSLGVSADAKLKEIAIPDQMVIDRIGEVWHKVKKHSVIALVLDKSGSMGGNSIANAKKGAKEFVDRVDSEDILMWMPFDTKPYGVLIEGSKEGIGEKLVTEYISGLSAGGNTALYDTVLDAHQKLSQIRDKKGDAQRYGIVVLTDGEDTNSANKLTDLERQLQKMESDSTGIQIFCIGIGEANSAVLKTIAARGNGKFFKGTPEELQKIYAEIVTYY